MIEKRSPFKIDFKKLFKVFAVLSVLIILLWIGANIRLPYTFEAPGECKQVKKMVNVRNARGASHYGRFYITSVINEQANVLLYIWGKVDSRADLEPMEPPEKRVVSDEKMEKILEIHMEMSKLNAQVAAFRAMGYDVRVKREPLKVLQVMKWSKAKDIIRKGDHILRLEGSDVKTYPRLKKLLKEYKDSGEVKMKIERDGKKMDVTVPLTPRGKRKMIGIAIDSKIVSTNLPMIVNIDSSRFIGGSAGLIFTLEIIRQVSGVDLTGGNEVAATGEIDEYGKIYPVAGVKYKVLAAEEQKVDYFLTPRENYDEAKKTAKKIKVIAVDNLDQALKELEKINSSASLKLYKPHIKLKDEMHKVSIPEI